MAEPPLFQAVVRPNRSLSPKALTAVICCMLAASLMVTSLMVLLRAWPVIGFNGADLALAVFLFRLNMRAARAREVICLRADRLDISRVDFNGRREEVSLQPYWLNIVLEERRGSVPRLLLAGGGAMTEIGRQLGEAQKRDLAAALGRALNLWRNPRFDNPQLRD